MDKNKPNAKRGKTLNTQDAKRLVMILAVASTLGFWVLFTNKARLEAANAAVTNDAVATDVPPAEAQNQVVLDLPPIPTLVPTLDSSANASVAIQPVPQTNTVSLPQPQPATTGKIFLGGSAPQQGGSVASQPRRRSSSGTVTVTRSSHP